MPYQKHTWQKDEAGGTPITAVKLNEIEAQLEANDLANQGSAASTRMGTLYEEKGLSAGTKTSIATDVANPETAIGGALSTAFVASSGPVDKSGTWRFLDAFPEVKGAAAEPVSYDSGAVAAAAWDIRKTGSGRLFHLVNADTSGSGDLIALGLDEGATNGMLVANKANGSGVIIGNHPSATKPGFQVTNYSQSSASGTTFLMYDLAASTKFIANNGQSFPNAQTTLGSTTLTCVGANFTSADVGSIIASTTSIDGTGIDTGTTIASVTNSTTVVLSKPAVSTSTRVNIIVSGRAYSTTQRMVEYFRPDGYPFLIQRVARTEFFQNVDFYASTANGSTTNQSYVRHANNALMFYQYTGSTFVNSRIMMADSSTMVFRMYAAASAGTESVYTDMLKIKKDSLGFFGATPVAQPVLATGATHTVDDVITTLQTLGLVKQS
jgi:hypothetical protein